MVFQCVAVVASLLVLCFEPERVPTWLYVTMLASVWIAVLSTIYSGAGYITAAARHFR